MASTRNLQQETQLELMLSEHLNALRRKAYSEYTIRNRLVHIRLFIRWCADREITRFDQLTSEVLQDYQQHVVEYRKANGTPLAVCSRHARLVPLRVWFRWHARQHHIADELSCDIELPRLGRPLPQVILSAKEVERVLKQPNLRTLVGVRDRAILEVLYSTGMRRLELVQLKLSDLQLDRGLVFINEGKGRRDRYVPIGERATYWVRRYLRTVRPAILMSDSGNSVFLGRCGRAIGRDHLTWIARRYVARANLGKTGACHLFRHTMASLMHEYGADIRFVQQMLGHADIRTTQIYTQVTLRALQRVHARTHPAPCAFGN